MRFVAVAALSVLPLGAFDTAPAKAAAWDCVGAEYVCGSSASKSKASWKKAKVAKTHRAKVQRTVYAKRAKKVAKRTDVPQPVTSPKAYSGGSVGIASYYWQGQMTASGARFNPNAMTAAHRTLPFGTRVLVTHIASGRSVTVTINDRGPFIKGRIIDLSSAAAGALGIKGSGLAKVSVSVVGR